MDIKNFLSISAEIPYDLEDKSLGSFKATLKTDYQSNEIFVLISSKGFTNPTQYPLEVYKGLNDFLSIFNLSVEKSFIYLDLLEYVGAKRDHVYKWESTNQLYFDKLMQINLDSDPKISRIINDYYRDKWSTFITSMLSNKDKVEIMASLFNNDLIDDYTRKEIANRFENLLNSIQGNSKFPNNLN